MNSTDAADRFRRMAARFTTVVDAIPSSAWGAPSPCEAWSVRDVVEHVVDSEREFLGRMPFGRPAGSPGVDEPAGDPLDRWRRIRDMMQAALDDPASSSHSYEGYFGPTTFAETVDTFYTDDLLVHSWDVARGAGLTALEPMDASDMKATRARLEPMGDALRSPGIYGPPVEPAGGGTAQAAFLAWTGRRA